MPDSSTYSMPEDPPLTACQESTHGDIFGALEVRQHVTIYDLALLIQGMMLSSMDSKGARPDYNDPEKIFDRLRTELRMRGQRWTDEYLERCYEVSITDPSKVEGVPLATRGQDTLYDAALVHAGEMFWPFVERHATTAEVRQMGSEAQRAYENGDSVRRVPAPRPCGARPRTSGAVLPGVPRAPLVAQRRGGPALQPAQDPERRGGSVRAGKLLGAPPQQRIRLTITCNEHPTKPMQDPPTTGCADCGAEVPLLDPLVNHCPECGAPHSSTGQRLKDDHNTASTLARERGRDPGVGDPGMGEPRAGDPFVGRPGEGEAGD